MACRLVGKYGVDWFNTHRLIILILGYRNLSCLTFNRGVMESRYSSTSDLGFVRLIDKIIARTSGQDRKTLIEAVYKISSDVRANHPNIRLLIKSTQSENIEAEAEMLVTAIKTARVEYWQLVQAWLDSVIPSDLDRLSISGGTGLYLKSELDKHLSWADPDWLDSKTGELGNVDRCLQFRFADVMALFESSLWSEKAA